MASFGKDSDGYSASRCVRITGAETCDNHTVYTIELLVGPYRWTVKHRYSEFHELHEKLVSQNGIDKHILPPKKVFGKLAEAFIQKRQRELEMYLRIVLENLTTLPNALVNFLHFHKYEIHGLTRVLAEDLYHKGDMLLQSSELFHISPLLLHCLSTRLKLPEPTCDSGDSKKDLGHILDFVTRLKYMKILGSEERIGTSNINMNGLDFDLNAFKSLEYLEIVQCNCALMSGIDKVKQTLSTLKVHHSLRAVKDIILCDVGQGHWYNQKLETVLVPAWSNLKSVDLSHNHISVIDQSVKLLPLVEYLDLSNNDLESVDQLQHLSALTHVNLACNNIRELHSLHTRFGNITSLNLAENHLESLQGFSKLYSLQYLNLSGNEISQLLEVRHLSLLPCLEKLYLLRNPLSQIIDYRTKVLERFAVRAKELCLDNEPTTQKEIDTVAVLVAIQKARESKERAKKKMTRQSARSEILHELGLPDDTLDVSSSLDSLFDDLELQGCPPSNISRSGDLDLSASSPAAADGLSTLLLPETLPTKSNTDFTTHLQSLVPDTRLLVEHNRGRHRPREERAIYVMWCPVLAYTQPYREIPACIYLTTDNIHIFMVNELTDATGLPDLTHVYCISLANVHQIVLSYQDLYLRIEEAYVGPQGTFAMLTGSPQKTAEFVNILRQTIERADAGKDQSDDTHITCNGETLLSLKAVLNRIEDLPCIDDVQVVLYMLVHYALAGQYKTHSLVLSNSCLYIMKEDYILWPQPTFGIGPAVRPKFEVLAAIPVTSRISAMQLYDTDAMSHRETLGESLNVTGIGTTGTPKDFVGYGVRIAFLAPEEGSSAESSVIPRTFDVRVPTSGMREKLLMSLTQVRKIHGVSLASPASTGHRDINKKWRSSRDSAKQKMSKSVSKESVTDIPAFSPPVETNVRIIEPSSSENDTPPMHNNSATIQEDSPPLPPPAMVRSAPDGDGAASGDGSMSAAVGGSGARRMIQTPSTLSVGYPSIKLLGHLSQCNESMELIRPLSASMTQLAAMSGEEVLNYFHKHIVPIGHVNEELNHLLWSSVVPYVEPEREINTCILLSNMALYFLSDESPRTEKRRRPSWKTHSRNRSDAVCNERKVEEQGPADAYHPQSGVLVCAAESTSHGRVKPYATLKLADLVCVHIGFFDQLFRICGIHEDASVFSCLTRDAALTELFLERLMSVLLSVSRAPTPSPVNDVEVDIFKTFSGNKQDGKWRPEGLEYKHPSKVRFIYPNEDAIRDLTFLMFERVTGIKMPSPSRSLARSSVSSVSSLSSSVPSTVEKPLESVKILQYLLVLEVEPGSRTEGTSPTEFTLNNISTGQARSLILTTTHLCLVTEDVVSYPLPDFARGLPDRPRFSIEEARNICSVQRVVCSDFTSPCITIVFAADDEICVDSQKEHYTEAGSSTNQPGNEHKRNASEKCWCLVIQNPPDKNKLIKLIERQLDVLDAGKSLSVQVSA